MSTALLCVISWSLLSLATAEALDPNVATFSRGSNVGTAGMTSDVPGDPGGVVGDQVPGEAGGVGGLEDVMLLALLLLLLAPMLIIVADDSSSQLPQPPSPPAATALPYMSRSGFASHWIR